MTEQPNVADSNQDGLPLSEHADDLARCSVNEDRRVHLHGTMECTVHVRVVMMTDDAVEPAAGIRCQAISRMMSEQQPSSTSDAKV